MPSLCDKCYDPGHCCRGFQLFDSDSEGGQEKTFWTDGGIDGVNEQLREKGWPYKATLIFSRFIVPDDDPVIEHRGQSYGSCLFNCSNLLPNGRCGDYENRPDICRNFEPASGPLCCHYFGEGVDLMPWEPLK